MIKLFMTDKQMGRPAEGLGGDEPEKIRDYPRLSITMRATTKRTLESIAFFQNRAAWQVVEDAISAYLNTMEPSDRKTISSIVKRTKGGK
jgi:predicted RNA-binding protein Jag